MAEFKKIYWKIVLGSCKTNNMHISYLFQKVKSRKLLMAGVESRLLLPFSE
jgi:hypothetical protein